MASLSSSSPSLSSMKNMEEEEKKLVSLKSFEGEIFQVDELVALQSETIKTMMSEGNGDTEFPVPNVKSKTLKIVIEYCEKHKHAVDDKASAEELRAWDSEFVKSFNTNVLYHLLLASNYLEVKGLLDLIIDWVAKLMKGKMPEQIRETFGIKNDFPPGMEEEIRNENPWAFEVPEIDKPESVRIQEKMQRLKIEEAKKKAEAEASSSSSSETTTTATTE